MNQQTRTRVINNTQLTRIEMRIRDSIRMCTLCECQCVVYGMLCSSQYSTMRADAKHTLGRRIARKRNDVGSRRRTARTHFAPKHFRSVGRRRVRIRKTRATQPQRNRQRRVLYSHTARGCVRVIFSRRCSGEACSFFCAEERCDRVRLAEKRKIPNSTCVCASVDGLATTEHWIRNYAICAGAGVGSRELRE